MLQGSSAATLVDGDEEGGSLGGILPRSGSQVRGQSEDGTGATTSSAASAAGAPTAAGSRPPAAMSRRQQAAAAGQLPPRGQRIAGHARRIAAAATAANAQWQHEGSAAGGQCPPLRISQAAQALVAQVERAAAAAGDGGVGAGVGARTSYEALQLRAAAMFTRSMDVQTGSLPWTKGELLGEGSFGRVGGGPGSQAEGFFGG